MRLQEQLATLSPKAHLIIAEGSGHDVQIDRPKLVVDAVAQMVSGTDKAPTRARAHGSQKKDRDQ
ncbi:MAG: hypothetical protein LJE69_13815 [Thiohalocapsa sp.]|jgi:pimeloyl-ACP methyl ester carboxylesterase|uniref:alpha/beta fold hydrolase n=1 Tax=Thiohalocapsa sp. TaxID=2497641 RepID=UPI0025FAFB3D|nr:hypothetical protein [Thiohalocapsa sp.]MCG6942313.1 hypothetical protein [Thiohalocapsa sp.]